MHLSEIQELISEKDKKIKELEEALEIKEKLKWESPVYYIIDDDSKDGPFCQQCSDKDHKLIRLQGKGDGFWECKACKNSYTEERWNARITSGVSDYDPYNND
jgi:hypothetical protein